MSFLSRSVIAVASLAIGSVALAATPASADRPALTPRELVLAVAQQEVNGSSDELERLIASTCDFDADEDNSIVIHSSTPFVSDNAHGVLVTAYLNEQAGEDSTSRQCTFAALATSDAAFALSGDAVITTTGFQYGPVNRRDDDTVTPTTYALSGNVFVTAPINHAGYFNLNAVSLTTTGNATRSVDVVATENAPYIKPRTAAGEKSSKAKYDKRLKAAAKWYAKKIKKAGTSKTKKAAATKTYTAKKAKYKKAYDKRYPGIKSSSKTTTQTENRPFNIAVDLEMRYAE